MPLRAIYIVLSLLMLPTFGNTSKTDGHVYKTFHVDTDFAYPRLELMGHISVPTLKGTATPFSRSAMPFCISVINA